ncbi:MAG: hypothetical protein LiPW41_575 [Parcubacteria group bacterium LiPW_41]|nr:MAG: hypothetical protein LiPW41_575 [Parcubacteria group bacterium LiPW_41]
MKKIIITSVVIGLVSSSVAFAQMGAATNTTEVKIPPIPTNIPLTKQMELRKIQEEAKIKREEIKTQVEATREAAKKEFEVTREATKKQIEATREATKKEADNAREAFKTEKEQILKALPTNPQEAIKMLQERRDVFQKEIEAKKESFKATIEAKREETEKAITAKKEELKTKLNQFKDERKKQVTEKVNNSLNEVNKNSVNRFTNNINELDKVVVHITTRAEKASVAGKNVDSVMAAVQNAKTAIEVARGLVSAQAAKIYSVTVSTEVKVADDLKKSRDQLNADLKVIQEKIRAAHDVVWVALGELQKIPEINKPVVSTTTPKESQAAPVVTQ